MPYGESEKAETAAHLIEVTAGKCAFCLRGVILAATVAGAVLFALTLGARAQQRNEGGYAEESSQELRKSPDQQRTLRAQDLDIHGSQQEAASASSKTDPHQRWPCDTAPDFCPNFHGSPD